MITKPIPDIIVSRLPRYLRLLQGMADAGKQTTSSQELGEHLHISAAQIRKDLSQFGEFGKQGTGYSISYLIRQLQSILNVDRGWSMVLIGAGDLGHAIARYQGFRNCGFVISMVFDNDPTKIGTKIGDFIVEDIQDLVPRVQEAGIKVAMVTVPASSAQDVVNCLVQAGVKAILNYAPVVVSVPPDVKVQYIDPVIHLQRMTYYLSPNDADR